MITFAKFYFINIIHQNFSPTKVSLRTNIQSQQCSKCKQVIIILLTSVTFCTNSGSTFSLSSCTVSLKHTRKSAHTVYVSNSWLLLTAQTRTFAILLIFFFTETVHQVTVVQENENRGDADEHGKDKTALSRTGKG